MFYYKLKIESSWKRRFINMIYEKKVNEIEKELDDVNEEARIIDELDQEKFNVILRLYDETFKELVDR